MACIRKHCVQKISTKNPDVPKNNSEKCLYKSSDSKVLSAVAEKLLNKRVYLIDAKSLIELLNHQKL